MSTPIFRRAERADVPRIVQLVNRAFAVETFFAAGDRTSDVHVGEMLAKGTFFLAETRDRLVGCVHAERRERGRGYIGMLAVDPAMQGHGLGRRLMRVAERYCLQAHCTEAVLTVINLRTELPPFYRSLGYQEVGTAPYSDAHRATQPIHFIVMRKRLSMRQAAD